MSKVLCCQGFVTTFSFYHLQSFSTCMPLLANVFPFLISFPVFIVTSYIACPTISFFFKSDAVSKMLPVAIKSLKLYVHFWCEPNSFFISKPSLYGEDDDLGSLKVSGSFFIYLLWTVWMMSLALRMYRALPLSPSLFRVARIQSRDRWIYLALSSSLFVSGLDGVLHSLSTTGSFYVLKPNPLEML